MVTKDDTEQLKRIKANIERSFTLFKKNNDRFHDFFRFVFESALDETDKAGLKELGKPIIEFNILNSFISRLCGEFSKQEPSISVRADNGMPVDRETIEVVEGHLRHILEEAKKRNVQYNVYKDQLGGGFGNMKIITEYAHEKSFDQVIKLVRTYEPTLTGYDPMAREMDKSDAGYSFELYPMSKEDFKSRYGDEDIETISYGGSDEGFSWAYESSKEKIIVLADYYEKKKKRKKIVKLADNRVMTMDDYNKFIESYKQQGFIEQPPSIVGEPRWTELVTIHRYILIKDRILESEETDYTDIPHIFADGDSVILKESSKFEQFTKPYTYHARGIQRLKNLAGQCLGNELEMMVQHKFMIAKESIPDEKEYQAALTKPQIASTIVYNAFMNNDPNSPVPPPREVARVASPPEVSGTFVMSDQVTQTILGSYDAVLGINDNQLSGIAIVEAATQSNATAMPYIVGHMQALTRAAQMIVEMIPKYYVTPRTIPVINMEGKRDYVKINQPGGVTFNYDENSLQVNVEAGVNFAIAKNRALQQIIALMNASPMFAQFINDEGIDVVLDNVEFRGSDILKSRVDEWTKKMKRMQAQAANKPDPQTMLVQAKMQEVQQKGQKDQVDAQLKVAELQVDQQKVENDRIELMIKAGESQDKVAIALTKAQAEEQRAAADLAIKHQDMKHRHAIDYHDRVTKNDE